jgi:hypothetical protein
MRCPSHERLDYIKEHQRHVDRHFSGWSEIRPGAGQVSVTHTLKPEVYDLPLTARTTIPEDWRLVRFRQGEDVRWLPVHREGGEPFVMYRIAPNGKLAR